MDKSTNGRGLLQPALISELSRRASAPAREVHEVRVLRDGEEAFPVMLDLIRSARQSVRFENFIFAGDATGRRFAGALGAAARRGVEVRVLYDPVGTMMVKGGSIAAALRAEGVTARAFRAVSLLAPWTWPRLRHRDHRKTMVVDGDTAVVGGLCISDNWAAHADGGHNWRDTALLVRGPVAGDVAVTQDIPLAAMLVPQGVITIDPRGDLDTALLSRLELPAPPEPPEEVLAASAHVLSGPDARGGGPSARAAHPDPFSAGAFRVLG
jgi:phosphatidylserine/phosphatidylglycerophosphate/cardiolipin synthase-like enzyme